MKTQTFLVKMFSGKQAVMRLPVGTRTGSLTTKAYKMLNQRFYDGATNTHDRLQAAINLEAYSNAEDLISVLQML